LIHTLINLTNESNLIDRLQYDLIRFFKNLEVAYFFEPPSAPCSPERVRYYLGFDNELLPKNLKVLSVGFEQPFGWKAAY